jgi:TolA-binding protein
MKFTSRMSAESSTFGDRLPRQHIAMTAMLLCLSCLAARAPAQSGPPQSTTSETAEQKIEHLTAALEQAQIQMAADEKQLQQLQQQLGSRNGRPSRNRRSLRTI